MKRAARCLQKTLTLQFFFLNRKSQTAKKSLDLVFTLVFRNLCYTMKNELCK